MASKEVRSRTFRVAIELMIAVVSVGWIVYLVLRPVYIPVQLASRELTRFPTESLSGLKVQTFVAEASRLNRIDLWVDTSVQPGGYVDVIFQIARRTNGGRVLASAAVRFDRSRKGWPVQLRFSPNLSSRGESLNLRLVSVLSTPLDHVYYLYSRSDYYPRGELLESDELRASGQDLIFEQFRAPLHSKPLAWAELVMARVSEAATKSGAYHPLLLGLLLALVTLTTIAITATASIAVARLLVVEATPITHGAFFLVLLAAVLGVLAGGELPFGKVVLALK